MFLWGQHIETDAIVAPFGAGSKLGTLFQGILVLQA